MSDDDEAVLIPWKELESATLDNLLGEIVTRDGTDYGMVEQSTAKKILTARRSLEEDKAVLYWNVELESAALMGIDQIRENQQTYAALAKAVGMSDS